MTNPEVPIRILYIEDERAIARFVELELRHEGYQVRLAHDGPGGLALAQNEAWDVILLDIMLPGLSGLEILRRLAADGAHAPVIMLTAKDDSSDTVQGLDAGASDYLTKPFAIEELLARIRRVLRERPRPGSDAPATRLQAGRLCLDLPARSAMVDGEPLELSRTEYDLLAFFVSHPDQVFTRDEILNAVWGPNFYGDTGNVDVYVRYLRAKIDDVYNMQIIRTVRGVGYGLKRQPASEA
ncbi:MAG: response regulator transcription factor [Bacillota bacterium]|nr:response regulator transcription factor [Bacillota bacterium]